MQPRYQRVEFASFQPYTQHLMDVRDTVLAWAKSAAKSTACGSVYLYSEPGPHGPGNGNGKTMLMTVAFKYVARRRAMFYWPEQAAEPSVWSREQINLGAFILDLKRDVIDRYRRSYQSDAPVNLAYFDGLLAAHAITGISVDELVVKYLGRVPILFIDDVGRGVKQGTMGAQLYEDLFNERANNNRPTFITTNYAPDNLTELLGSRSVSRILRNQCTVIQVRAADFSAVRLQTRG
jgi:predicted ATPase